MGLNLRRFSLVVLAAALAFCAIASTPAEAARHHKRHPVSKEQDRFAEIVIDANTGYVYSQKNPDKHLYPASLTKMMTLYLTFDALEDGQITKGTRISVSRHAASQEPSSLGLSEGDTIRVEDCILGIATKSANDCAVALGEALGGSESRFAVLMTQKARSLGMMNTNFVNASGLFRPQQYSSARDMSILARALIRNHPRYYHYFSTKTYAYKGETFANHNHLMSSYRGMDGLKTGYVYASGYNLAASAVRNGTRLIGVVFGGRTAASRNNAMAQLLNQAFAASANVNRVAAAAAPRNVSDRVKTKPRAETEQASDTTAAQTGTTQTVQAGTAQNIAQAGPQPQFSAIGLKVEQGDAADTPATAPQLQPQALNAAPVSAQAGAGDWAIQIGAYSSHDAGEKALQFAKQALGALAGSTGFSGNDSIAPLMTPRGMIYRARLSGLPREGATQACRILKGNCLVLAAE